MNRRTLRDQMHHLQRPAKRTRRELLTLDESSLQVIRQPETEETGQISCQSEDNENDDPMPVQFSFGKTQRGGKCLWFGGFRYIRNNKNHFRCSNLDCKRTAAIDRVKEEHAVGRLLEPDHNHVAEPSRRDAEKARHEMKVKIVERNGPRTVPSKVLPCAREVLNDEAFFIAGSDDALTRMMRGEKAKIYKNVNIRDTLLIDLPEQLLMHKGQSMLLYDSRVERPGQRDTVLVFSHPNLLEILRSNLKLAVDGTFHAAPSPWAQLWVVGCFVKRRIVMCVNCLLPGKRLSYYEEALRAIKRAISPVEPIAVMSDFEKAELMAFKRVFPNARPSGCQFHRGQFLMRKWKDFGLFVQANQENERAEMMRRTFRDVLSLAYIPPHEVRRAFALVVERAPIGCQSFLGYFARVFIGLTASQIDAGVDDAFAPEIDLSYRTATTLSARRSSIPSNESVLFGRPSPCPSTPTMNDDHNYGQHCWMLPIVRRPQYEIDFWNVHHRALFSIEKTNNAQEAAHQQFAKGLNHHPSLSDLLFALLEDIEKQCDIARSAQAFKHVRRKRYVIQEERLLNTLSQAEYDTNEDLCRVITLVGLQLQGFVAGIRVREIEDEREVETEGSGMTSHNSDTLNSI